MEAGLTKSSEAMNERHRRRRRWYKVLSVLAAVVVFWTTYALVLPAITMTEEYHCGMEEHIHDASCYTGGAVRTSVCSAEADYAGYILIHGHGELCRDSSGALICTLPEVGTHLHTDACYLVSTSPACGMEEFPAHAHTEDCYETQDVLVCELPETDGHSHTDECYDETGALICAEEETEGHVHAEECYAQESVLICGMEETEGHLHSEECGVIEERSLVCGQTELIPHMHSEECLDASGAYICALPEAVEHTHTEACFAQTGSDEDRVLTCGKQEHTHELICTSDKTADLETAEQWEATLPDKAAFTGVWADDLLAVASSQLGYTESVNNFDVGEDGLQHGYTRYGEWYGLPYGDWCAMYVSFSLNYAGIPREAVPYEASCQPWTEQLAELGLYHSARAADYTPARGDIVFFADDGVTASHVGIVCELDDEHLSAIEGNCANQVRICTYVPDDAYILGWMSLAEAYDRAAELGLVTPAEVADICLEADYGDIHVVLTAAPDALPAGLTDLRLVVTVPGEQAQQQIEKIVSAEDDYFALDIKIMSGEEEIQPLKTVKVKFEVKSDAFNELGVDVYHIKENAATEDETMEKVASSIDEDGSIVMETEHFSTYLVTTSSKAEKHTAAELPHGAAKTGAAARLYDLSGDIGVSSEGYTDTEHTIEAVYDFLAAPNMFETTQRLVTNYMTDHFGNNNVNATGGTVWIYDTDYYISHYPQSQSDKMGETAKPLDGRFGNSATQINEVDDSLVPHRITAEGVNELFGTDVDYYFVLGEQFMRIGGTSLQTGDKVGAAALKIDHIGLASREKASSTGYFDDFNSLIQCRGNKLVIGEGVTTMPYQVISIIGGAYQNAETTRSPSYIVVESAHIHQIAGGGTADMGNADMPLGTNIAVRGNAEVDFIYGGGASTGNLYGNSKILVEGGSVGAVFGGGLVKAGVLNYKGIKTDGDVEVDISGGHVNYVEAGPANGSNITIDANGFITSVTDAFYGGIITGKADVNISAVNGASYVYGDVFRNYGNQVGTVGADSMRRVKGLTSLNVSASNHFADMDYFDIVNIRGNGAPQSTLVYADDNIGYGKATAQGGIINGGYVGRLDLKNGAALFIDRNAYVNCTEETQATAEGGVSITYAFSGEADKANRANSTLMIDGSHVQYDYDSYTDRPVITASSGSSFDKTSDKAGMLINGNVEGYSTLVCSGTRPDGTVYEPVYSTGDDYYYYVVADSSDHGGSAFKEPDGADYVVCYRYLNGGEQIGWYLRERPTITIENRFVRAGMGANPILSIDGTPTGDTEKTEEHFMILHVDMNGFAYEWSSSDKNRVEMSWDIFDGTEAPTDATTRTGGFTLETMASITVDSENFRNVMFTDGPFYDEGGTYQTERLQSFDYILDSTTANEPSYYDVTVNWDYKVSDDGVTYQDVRFGQEADAARCIYDFAGNEEIFTADTAHGSDGYDDSVMTTYPYKDGTPPNGNDNALLRIYLPYGVSAAGFTAEKVAAGTGDGEYFEFIEDEHTGSIVRNSDVAANYTTDDASVYNHHFGVTMQREGNSEHDLDEVARFTLGFSGTEKIYCWVYSHEKLDYEDITKWSADGLRLYMTLNSLTRNGAAVGAAGDDPSTYSNGELRIQTKKVEEPVTMTKFTVKKQITDSTDPDTTAVFDFTMSYKLSDGNTKKENFVLSHGKQQTFLVPAGTEVTVVENQHDGYYVKILNSDTGDYEFNDTITITVTDSDPDGVTVTFYNSPGTELPKTGGSGAAMYAFGGLLTALAVCGYARRKRREGRGEA